MASFIVISASDRLHYIVDGIEKCRPQNLSVTTNVSTGKIIKSEDGYVYEYGCGEDKKKYDRSRPLHEYLANQLAQFRLAYTIPRGDVVNIFFLENPLNQEDFEKLNSWIWEFKKLYDDGNGYDVNFCLYRLLFTYNLDDPTDVVKQIEVPVLKKLLEDHRKRISDAAEAFHSYIFYIDNQKNDAAAMCLSKEEHDLKLPRFLMDFMMLVSDSSDSYNVKSAINRAGSPSTNCFSVGFAESMYYYPDVEDYFTCADKRDLLSAFLTGEDDMAGDDGKKAMNVEEHPFGLRKRKKRLEGIYGDVPFPEDIHKHPGSADKKIDDCIVRLKDCIEAEREMDSAAVKDKKSHMEAVKEQLETIVQDSGESEEEFESRLKTLQDEVKSLEEELKNAEFQFDGEHPEYTDRTAIYRHVLVAPDPDKVAETEGRQYENLVSHVTSAKFLDFAKTEDAKTPAASLPPTGNNNGEQAHKGFFSRFLAWLRLRKRVEVASIPAPVVKPDLTESIKEIAELIRLKKDFLVFKKQVDNIEREYEAEEKYCKDFELTGHTNHYFLLINLAKMKEEQSSTSKARRDEVIEEWKKQRSPTRTSLVALVKDRTARYTKKEFLYIKWDSPYSFVQMLDVDILSTVCNELQKRSAPFVHYNLRAELEENKVIRAIYSDCPKVKRNFDEMKPHIYNSNEILAYHSTHIASKICFMQFLQMDDDVLSNLVDLREKRSQHSGESQNDI